MGVAKSAEKGRTAPQSGDVVGRGATGKLCDILDPSTARSVAWHRHSALWQWIAASPG
ncbi:MAG: hypothetical protein ABNH38_16840 [Tateyamaria sp.]